MQSLKFQEEPDVIQRILNATAATVRATVNINAELRATDDFREGTSAFLEGAIRSGPRVVEIASPPEMATLAMLIFIGMTSMNDLPAYKKPQENPTYPPPVESGG
jgi:hypothetical protein